MERKAIDISWSSLWRILAMLVFVIAIFYAREAIMMFLIAVVISSALHAPISYLEKKKIPRILSVIVIFIVGIGILSLILYALVPVTLIQLKNFLANIDSFKINLPLLDEINVSDLISRIDTSLSGILDALFYGGSSLVSVISSFIGNLFFIFILLVISFYLSLSPNGVENFIRAVFPASKEDYVVSLYVRTRRKLGRWLSGQLAVSFFVGFFTFIGLLILGVDYALVLALLAAALELVPYVGPILVGIIAFLLALPQSLTLALLSVLIFFIIQQVENHVLVPFIMSRAVGLDPVVIVIAILAGSEIGGLVGLILAVPVTIIIQEVLDDWSERKRSLRSAEVPE